VRSMCLAMFLMLSMSGTVWFPVGGRAEIRLGLGAEKAILLRGLVCRASWASFLYTHQSALRRISFRLHCSSGELCHSPSQCKYSQLFDSRLTFFLAAASWLLWSVTKALSVYFARLYVKLACLPIRLLLSAVRTMTRSPSVVARGWTTLSAAHAAHSTSLASARHFPIIFATLCS
jgi:hypothetical protein